MIMRVIKVSQTLCDAPQGLLFNLHTSFSSISTVSCLDELGQHDDNARMPVTMENTYQLGEVTLTCTTSTPRSSRCHQIRFWLRFRTRFSSSKRLGNNASLFSTLETLIFSRFWFIFSTGGQILPETARVHVHTAGSGTKPTTHNDNGNSNKICCRCVSDHRASQTLPCHCCHRDTEGCSQQLPPGREVWSRVVSKDEQNNMWGKWTLYPPTVQTLWNICSGSDSCFHLRQVIRARVKDLLIPRYKTVVLVHIGQLAGQSIQISSRCLWDASSDTFASFSFKNRSLFGVANVYAVYFEWHSALHLCCIFWNVYNDKRSQV